MFRLSPPIFGVLILGIMALSACAERIGESSDVDAIGDVTVENSDGLEGVAPDGEEGTAMDGGLDGEIGEGDADVAPDLPLPGNPVGGECSVASDCSSNFCYDYPLGGYCTYFCTIDEDCPGSSECHTGVMVTESACYKPCQVEEDCRDTQHCVPELNICAPDCRVGECLGGQKCNFDTGMCVDPEVCEPVEEECNENDDDCDERIDEGCGPVEILPAGVGFIDLGLVPLGAATVQAVDFEIPPGTESFTIVVLADDQAFLTATSLTDPLGMPLVNVENVFESINRAMPSEGALTVLVPNAPASYSPPSGTFTIGIYKEGDYSLNPVMVFTKGLEPFDTPLFSTFDAVSPGDNDPLDGWAKTLESETGVSAWAHNADVSVMGAVSSAEPWSDRHLLHQSILLRSPAFEIPEGCTILFTLAGGKGGAEAPRPNTDTNPIESTESGFMGVALRRVSDGAYILSRRRGGKSPRFLNIEVDAAELSAATEGDAPEETYTLDLIDEYHGGWGWISVGYVVVFSQPLYLDINLYFVGVDGVDSTNYETHEVFGVLLETFWEVFAQGNIRPGNVEAYDILGADEEKYSFLDKTLTGAGELPELLALSSAHPDSNALNIFFVEDIANLDDMDTLGIAGAIPGPPLFQGSGSSGVVVAMSRFFDTQGEPAIGGARTTAQAMAHECGHYLGLYHVTEKPGTVHDDLLDTPECADGDDEDDLAGSGECSGKGNDNLMFWSASGRSELSREQITVIRSNPQLRQVE